jgi:hypothetical protein
MFTAAIPWGTWKLRNNICFQNGAWKNNAAFGDKF